MEKLNFRNRRRKNAYIIDERLSQRAVSLANYMIENKSTVRQAAKVFGVSKSTVHTEVINWNGLYGRYSKKPM